MGVVTFNSFIEDTATCLAAAFLLVRGRLLTWLGDDRVAGLLFGVAAATEAAFPGERFPYAPHIVALAFATAHNGVRAGSIAGGLLVCSAIAFGRPPVDVLRFACEAVGVVALIAVGRRFGARPFQTYFPFVVVAGVEAIAVASTGGRPDQWWLVPATCLGYLMVVVVFFDADRRAEFDRLRSEAEAARALAAEARLAVVRSRIQPHFLFNALNAIAALCRIAPERAATATVRLSKLMRRALDDDPSQLVTLRRELEMVEEYVAIERERFMDKLTFESVVVDADDIQTPAFSIQILVENAILHGVTRVGRGGGVRVETRRRPNGWQVAVTDDGLPLSHALQVVEGHGLSLLDERLRARFGRRSRIRLFRRHPGGVLATFFVPRTTQ